MKNKNLIMLVKASALSRKLSANFFCFFIIISTALILISVSIILPLWDNIENKIVNHISARELVTEFAENASEESINETIAEIKKIDYIKDVYRMPSKLTVTEQSGVLSNEQTLGFVHNDSNLIITSGRAFGENETGVAIVPQTIKDFNSLNSRIDEISGADLIGKTLVLNDICGNTHKTEVIGVYSTSDPIFSENEILIPQSDLIKYNELVLNGEAQEMVTISNAKSYIIVTDYAKNTEKAAEQLSGICSVYQNSVLIDADSYNTALIILIAALILFIILVIAGFFMFLKSNIDSRTDELALYRSLGYKSKHIFTILFAEHLIFGVLSLAAGIIITIMLNHFIVNPYLYTLVGNTLMEITASVTVSDVVCLIIFFAVILCVVCKKAVVRSERIDLTVLLREQ